MSEPSDDPKIPHVTDKSRKKRLNGGPASPLPAPNPNLLTREEAREFLPKMFQGGSPFKIPEHETRNLPETLGYFIGAQEKDVYRMLERTRFTPEEKSMMVDIIRQAEHGIGVENYDFPTAQIGEWAVHHMRANVSLEGDNNARSEFERVLTAWTKRLDAEELAQKERAEQRLKGGG